MNNSNIDVFKVITDVIIFSDLFWSDIIKKFYDIRVIREYLFIREYYSIFANKSLIRE